MPRYEQLPDGRVVPVQPKQQAPMRGAGDVVARATTALGITPCDACEQRRQLLNSMFPFRGRRQV